MRIRETTPRFFGPVHVISLYGENAAQPVIQKTSFITHGVAREIIAPVAGKFLFLEQPAAVVHGVRGAERGLHSLAVTRVITGRDFGVGRGFFGGLGFIFELGGRAHIPAILFERKGGSTAPFPPPSSNAP